MTTRPTTTTLATARWATGDEVDDDGNDDNYGNGATGYG